MPTSDSHRIAVLKQDNGELQEDVVARDVAESGGSTPGGLARQSPAEVDRQSVESFPASDAPSSWAGPPDAPGVPPGDQAEGSADSGGRVVTSEPAPDVPERDQPGDPVPGTLPRQHD